MLFHMCVEIKIKVFFITLLCIVVVGRIYYSWLLTKRVVIGSFFCCIFFIPTIVSETKAMAKMEKNLDGRRSKNAEGKKTK